MVRMDHRLFDTQYFHGSLDQAELGIRAWALIHNFVTKNPVTIRRHHGWQSPAERLNQFRYSVSRLGSIQKNKHKGQP